MMSQLQSIRQRFNEGDIQVANMLPKSIQDSWLRCNNHDLDMTCPAEYYQMTNDCLQSLKYRHNNLLSASNPHLEHLFRSVAPAGWSVLLTDTNCHALTVKRSAKVINSRIMSAFKDGVVLDEQSVGTTAMSCAFASGQFTRVFGGEHYKDQHNSFHCAAAPIFNEMGELCASLDITNEQPLDDYTVFFMLETCAKNIQKSLILNLPNAFILEIIPSSGQFGDVANLLLAVSTDGKIVGSNEASANFLISKGMRHSTSFENLFSSDFRIVESKRAIQGEPFYLQLHTGVTFVCRVLATPSNPRTTSKSAANNLSLFNPASNSITTTITDSNRRGAESDTAINKTFGDQQLSATIDKAAKVIKRLPVLLLGESGVGKEVTAQHLHTTSQCSGKFVSINCSAIPENLIESELFGYHAGAFTGADKKGFKGRIVESHQGTLFLDEIGDMPLALQSRLLRVLETREVSPLGSAKSQKVDFQLICATHVNLEQAIAQGTFRQDLYFRLKGFALNIKPLRERTDKIAIAQSILTNECERKTSLSQSMMQFINCYAWPGNIRELRNVLLYADAIGDDTKTICTTELPDEYRNCIDCSAPVTEVLAEPVNGQLLEQANLQLIQQVVANCEGNMSQAARELGISRATLYRKLAKSVV